VTRRTLTGLPPLVKNMEYVLHSADVDNLRLWEPESNSPWQINVQVLIEGENCQFQLTSQQ